MAYRLDIKRILSMNFFHDLPQIMLGCALAAIATDLFLIPNGLAAGGVTGLDHYPGGRCIARPIASRWHSDDRDERLAVVGRYARG